MAKLYRVPCQCGQETTRASPGKDICIVRINLKLNLVHVIKTSLMIHFPSLLYSIQDINSCVLDIKDLQTILPVVFSATEQLQQGYRLLLQGIKGISITVRLSSGIGGGHMLCRAGLMDLSGCVGITYQERPFHPWERHLGWRQRIIA